MGSSSALGRAGAGGGIRTSTRSPPRSREDDLAPRPSTVIRPSRISACSRERLRSGREAVRC